MKKGATIGSPGGARCRVPAAAPERGTSGGARCRVPDAAPLISLLPFQTEAFWTTDAYGFALWLWRRQAGKTTTLSALALRRMMEKVWRLVTYASASIAVGGEMLIREAQLWQQAMEAWRRLAADRGRQLQTTADGIDFDAFCEMFEHGKIEARLYHDKTSYSRTRLIAPNPATARGYTGFVMIDEIGFIRALKDLWEAMEPIASREPDFRVVMCTTPPNDDAHYSYELAVPEPGTVFIPNPRGTWYTSQAGIQVHRVDAWDAAAAGVKLYDIRTRQPLTPEEHRARAIDRDAWDRNYALAFKTGGAAAIGLLEIEQAMARGAGLGCLAAEGEPPPDWRARLGRGPVGIGVDLASTVKGTSNPSAIAVVERDGPLAIVRMVYRFRESSSAVMLERIADAAALRGGRAARRVCLDASGAGLYPDVVRRRLAGICPVQSVMASAKDLAPGQETVNKAWLGNLLVNAFQDGRIAIPAERWLKDDLRLVVRERGSFETRQDSAGNHGDCFDAIKLALVALEGGGPAEARPAPCGALGWPRAWRTIA